MTANHSSTSSRKPHPAKPCLQCGQEFRMSRPSHTAKRSFCSASCCQKYQVGVNNPNYRGGMVERPCQICGKIVPMIPARVTTFRYCDRTCKAKAHSLLRSGENSHKWRGAPPRKSRAIPGARVKRVSPRVCKKCGEVGVRKGRSYHQECSPNSGKSVEIQCVDCGAVRVVWPNASRALATRCKACDNASRSGQGNSNWKGGITPINKKIRASNQYKEWRTKIFERDNYTCAWCGQHGGQLNADHIKPFALHPELRFDLINGRTLCVECHKKTDTYLNKSRHPHRMKVQHG